ncbi:transcriptional regulator [Desulfobacterales bacterium HSG16]|nr:transcriptional regulator [Desulfobacterales bacterium HSG16]
MARGDQLGRQWKILNLLLSSQKGKTAAEISQAIECHQRTVYRDLEALQVAGFPIYTDRLDGKNLWSLLDTVKKNIPIPVSLTELVALYFSRDMLKFLKETVFYDSIESFFQKVKTTLPPQYLKYLEKLEQTFLVNVGPYGKYGEYREIINQVNEAAIDRNYIDIVYFAQSRQARTKRRVAPYRIFFYDQVFYMIGHCMLRQGIRIFALDRIESIENTDKNFDVPEDFSFEQFMKSSFGVFTGKARKVKIKFSSDIAGYIQEKIWHETQKIEPCGDGSIIFEADVAITDELKSWIMKWGAKAMVQEPESLKKKIENEAIRMLAQYRQG